MTIEPILNFPPGLSESITRECIKHLVRITPTRRDARRLKLSSAQPVARRFLASCGCRSLGHDSQLLHQLHSVLEKMRRDDLVATLLDIDGGPHRDLLPRGWNLRSTRHAKGPSLSAIQFGLEEGLVSLD